MPIQILQTAFQHLIPGLRCTTALILFNVILTMTSCRGLPQNEEALTASINIIPNVTHLKQYQFGGVTIANVDMFVMPESALAGKNRELFEAVNANQNLSECPLTSETWIWNNRVHYHYKLSSLNNCHLPNDQAENYRLYVTGSSLSANSYIGTYILDDSAPVDLRLDIKKNFAGDLSDNEVQAITQHVYSSLTLGVFPEQSVSDFTNKVPRSDFQSMNQNPRIFFRPSVPCIQHPNDGTKISCRFKVYFPMQYTHQIRGKTVPPFGTAWIFLRDATRGSIIDKDMILPISLN